MESLGRDADVGRRMSIELNLFVDDGAVAIEALLPVRIAENDDGIRAWSLALRGQD